MISNACINAFVMKTVKTDVFATYFTKYEKSILGNTS